VKNKTSNPASNAFGVSVIPDELPGCVFAQYRRRGKRTYGPYYLYAVWQDGRRTTLYVKQKDVEAMRGACQRYRERMALIRKQRVEADAKLRQIREQLWEITSIVQK